MEIPQHDVATADQPGDSRSYSELLAMFQRQLRLLREGEGKSQRTLAAAIGASHSLVSQLETDPDANPGLETLGMLARYFGVSVGQLLGETELERAMQGPTSWQHRALRIFETYDNAERDVLLRILEADSRSRRAQT